MKTISTPNRWLLGAMVTLIASLPGCSDDTAGTSPSSISDAQTDTASGIDGASFGDTTTSDTADTLSPDTATTDTATTDTATTDTATTDTATTDTATTDTATTDTATTDTTDTAALDTGTSDTAATDATATDTASTDTASTDTASTDASANDTATDTAMPDTTTSCTIGALKRCWVECVQTYVAGCIHGDLPPRIPGTQTCTANGWGVCSVPQTCDQLAGECTNATKKPLTYMCLDGSSKTGEHHCIKPLGAKCAKSYWAGYGATDCPHICTSSADLCANVGDKEPCEVFCDKADGAAAKGERSCQGVCNTQVWSACQTGDACWKAAGSPEG